jgi:CubicO group peptidase (beta-lactamase class C family)
MLKILSGALLAQLLLSGSLAPAQSGAGALRGAGTSGGAPMVGPGTPQRDRVGGFHVPSHQTSLVMSVDGQHQLHFPFGFGNIAFVDATPIAGDFDGDGFDTVGLFESRSNEFHLKNRNRQGPQGVVFQYGPPNTFPVVGDWDGDGVDTIGVFEPTSNTFHLRNANSPGGADLTFSFGPLGALGVVGDWDGDGIDTIGVYHTSTDVFHLRNSNSNGAADEVFSMPAVNFSVPFSGDFNGDGRDTVGLFDKNTYEFRFNPFHQNNVTTTLPYQVNFLENGDWFPLIGFWREEPKTLQYQGYQWQRSTPAAENIDEVQLDSAYSLCSAYDPIAAMLVFRNGFLCREEYYRGYDRSVGINIKSISKTVLGALAGIAMDQGLLTSTSQTVESILPQHFNPSMDPRKYQITLENCWTMTAGFQWNELTFFSPMINSNDWVQYVWDRPQQNDPGSSFLYSTGLTHTMAKILTTVSGLSTSAFAQEFLFDPLGVELIAWDKDVEGQDFGGSEVYLVPRDIARFGHLYLRDGLVDGNQIISTSWVNYSTSALVPASMIDFDRSYGAWWWRNDFGGEDLIYAIGWGGSFCFVLPTLDAMVVFASRWDVDASQSAPVTQFCYDLMDLVIVPSFQ